MENNFDEIKKIISKEKNIIKEVKKINEDIAKTRDVSERRMISSQINSLLSLMKKENEKIPWLVKSINLPNPLPVSKKESSKEMPVSKYDSKKQFPITNMKMSAFEKQTLKRLKQKGEKKEILREDKPSNYIKISNRLFSELSTKVVNKEEFSNIKRDLIKSGLQYLPKSYLSIIFFTTTISFFVAIPIMLFFLFFSVSAIAPLVKVAEGAFLDRLLKVIWIPVVIPILTFFMMYLYPSAEKKSIETRINEELPFAAINMSAIAGSMIDPTRIFEIIIATKEYPYLEKEFTKLINETNILGYDLISALRNRAFNSPSKKLAELFNGLATTINSGGDMVEFFSKRSQTLLFDYKLEREKYNRSSETYMDIYISVVIAAPMILMLLLMIMQVSGLGVGISTPALTLLMILGVFGINLLFLAFLHFKQPGD
ncbi:type II secretion system F family protein [Candidatus Pacearchaeota archaeon]|nr:type II secretion system F family protein [Candidatus Pacearchaeota archaeon]